MSRIAYKEKVVGMGSNPNNNDKTLKLLPVLLLVPEARQRQPAWQQPGSVSETPVQVCVQLSHLLIQQASDFLPM